MDGWEKTFVDDQALRDRRGMALLLDFVRKIRRRPESERLFVRQGRIGNIF